MVGQSLQNNPREITYRLANNKLKIKEVISILQLQGHTTKTYEETTKTLIQALLPDDDLNDTEDQKTVRRLAVKPYHGDENIPNV